MRSLCLAKSKFPVCLSPRGGATGAAADSTIEFDAQQPQQAHKAQRAAVQIPVVPGRLLLYMRRVH